MSKGNLGAKKIGLPIGYCALERIWREGDLAHIKASWALFQQISADTKDLDDIPRD